MIRAGCLEPSPSRNKYRAVARGHLYIASLTKRVNHAALVVQNVHIVALSQLAKHHTTVKSPMKDVAITRLSAKRMVCCIVIKR